MMTMDMFTVRAPLGGKTLFKVMMVQIVMLVVAMMVMLVMVLMMVAPL